MKKNRFYLTPAWRSIFRRLLWHTTAFMLLTSLFFLPACEKEEDNGPSRAKWTIMGYFNGNNDLDVGQAGTSYIIKDLQEMEWVGSTRQVKSVIMLGSLKTGGNVACYEIGQHENQLPDEILSPVALDLGTKDMSDPQTLIDFIAWCSENYPAERYALIINSHGAAWYGLCPDEINGSDDLMSMPKMRSALANAPHLDVIVFHACLMGSVEVAYELKDYADYMVACETTMPALGILGADTWLAELVDNPKMDSYDLSKRIAQCVYDEGVEAQRFHTHMAVTDLSQIDALGAKLSEFGNRLVSEVGDNWDEVYESWEKTHYISDNFPSLTDLREFVKEIMQRDDLGQINLINNAADELLSALNAAISFTKSNSLDVPFGGLSIHFPNNEENFRKEAYQKLQFAKTNWHNFVAAFIENAGNGGGGGADDEARIYGTVTWPGHNLSENTSVLVCYQENDELNILGSVGVEADGTYGVIITGLQQPQDFLFAGHDDVNGNGTIDGGDGFGFWDKDQDGNWTTSDILNVEPGHHYTDINIALAAQKSLAVKSRPWMDILSTQPRHFSPSGVISVK